MQDNHFLAAYQELMPGIEADPSAVAGLEIELREMFIKGCYPRDAIKAIDRWLPAGSWRWPAFEAQLHLSTITDPAELLHHRLWRMAYAIRDEEQFSRAPHFAPYKLFSPIMEDRTPSECRALHGTVKRHDDEFWVNRRVPCERLDCRCAWIAVSQRDVDRLSGRKSTPRTE